jgi:hypothetical protein
MMRFLLLAGIEWTDANQPTVLVVAAFALPTVVVGTMSLLRWLQ